MDRSRRGARCLLPARRDSSGRVSAAHQSLEGREDTRRLFARWVLRRVPDGGQLLSRSENVRAVSIEDGCTVTGDRGGESLEVLPRSPATGHRSPVLITSPSAPSPSGGCLPSPLP